MSEQSGLKRHNSKAERRAKQQGDLASAATSSVDSVITKPQHMVEKELTKDIDKLRVSEVVPDINDIAKQKATPLGSTTYVKDTDGASAPPLILSGPNVNERTNVKLTEYVLPVEPSKHTIKRRRNKKQRASGTTNNPQPNPSEEKHEKQEARCKEPVDDTKSAANQMEIDDTDQKYPCIADSIKTVAKENTTSKEPVVETKTDAPQMEVNSSVQKKQRSTDKIKPSTNAKNSQKQNDMKSRSSQPAKNQKSKEGPNLNEVSIDGLVSTKNTVNNASGNERDTLNQKNGRRPQEPCRVDLFRHLNQPDKRINVLCGLGLGSRSPIHPAFLALGVEFDERRIWGSNARCIAFLKACVKLIRAHNPARSPLSSSGVATIGVVPTGPAGSAAETGWPIKVVGKGRVARVAALVDEDNFARSFAPVLHRHIAFIEQCRPMAVTMRTAVQLLKARLNALDSIHDWEQCRTCLLNDIDEFVLERVMLAGRAITARAALAIRPGECVATFAYSGLVAACLVMAWTRAQADRLDPSAATADAAEFSVLVIDAPPHHEGRRMLAELTAAGVPCEYTHIAALPAIASKISLVLLGAHGLLSNGHVLSRMGAAQVANVATRVSHAPVLVCAETYKFWERAQSDAVEYNELADPDDLWRNGGGGVDVNWRDNANLRLLHLAYDVLPPGLVTAVVTELGILPTSSVPVVLRLKQTTNATHFIRA